MLRPERMQKVRVICIRPIAPKVIKALHQLSMVHLKDAQLPGISKAGPMPNYDEIASRLIRVRAMLEELQQMQRINPPKKKIAFENLLKEADLLLQNDQEMRAIAQEIRQCESEIESLENGKASLGDFANFDLDFSALRSQNLQFLFLKTSKEKEKQAKENLSKMKNCAYLCEKTAKGEPIFLIALPAQQDARFLEKFGALVQPPQLSTSPKEMLLETEKKLKEAKQRLEQARQRLARFAQKHGPRLIAVKEALQIEADRAEIAMLFSSTDMLYIIEGWVEKKKHMRLKEELKKMFGKKVAVLEAPIDEHHETPPTLLSNPKPIKPFQFLVEFLSTTHYNEIDPSGLLALFVPLLYAMILGDAGYAIISFALASYLVGISKEGSLLRQIARIWQISAIPAFLLGVAFDEWFGFTHSGFFEKIGLGKVSIYTPFLHRVHQIETLILVVILVGAIHLGIGFIVGAINEWGHSRKHAIAKLAWLGIEIGGFFSVASFMFGAFSEFGIFAAALLLLSAIVMVASEGVIGAFEIPGLASNIMSYIRIAAVGVGGVILAEAINELLFPKWDLSLQGLVAFAIGAIAYLAIHVLSCVIAMFESFIHGTRLNVVEFFGKFYKGNGVKFSPFAVRRQYSQEI
ncbi:MAG: V-type ATP synthase subunit I [Candidatus Micrarchaeota archaeon]|nr:V-type ATP synthase subunit I [Candidatus Micrarchaeota archaeon]